MAIKPISVSEKLMYTTVRLETVNGVGTGSFFNFRIDNDYVPIIITNKHVIGNDLSVITNFFIHIADNNNMPTTSEQISLTTSWIPHSNKDLCFCYIAPLINHMEKQGKRFFYIPNDESIIPSKNRLENELTASEEVLMVGYPNGLWDIRNNLPIFRRGYTANHPGIDFNRDGIGLTDMACFPGSSGSPVYIYNQSGYTDKNGNINIGTSRLLLLGFHYAGYTRNAKGNIILQPPPVHHNYVTSTEIEINLGCYVKTAEINEFKSRIENDLKKQREFEAKSIINS